MASDKGKSYFETYFLDALLATGNVTDACRLLAVGAFESGEGSNPHSRQHNNHHGVTSGASWKGPTFVVQTKNGPLVFREYASDLAAFRDWVKFMEKLYPEVWTAKTDAEFVQRMGEATRYHGTIPSIYSNGVRTYLTYYKQLANAWIMTAGAGMLGLILILAIVSTFE